MDYDIVIVGGGPAGLSAALALGRAIKRVLLCDAGTPRNAAAAEVHNFVTRDGIPPGEFRRIAREQLAKYTTVTMRDVRVAALAPAAAHVAVTLEDGTVVTARRVRALIGDGRLESVELEDGTRIARAALAFRPPQRPAALVESLGLARNEMGYVRVDESRESSVPRVHVAGDATTPMQAAVAASADGMIAAAMMNRLLVNEATAQLVARAQAAGATL